MTDYLPPTQPTSLPPQVRTAPSLGRSPIEEPNLAPLDLRMVLATLRRRWVMILLGAALAAGVVQYLAYRRVPVYRATAVIRLADARRAVAGALGGGDPREALAGRVVDPLLSLIETMTSRRVAGTVVDSVPVLRLRVQGFPLAALAGIHVDSTAANDSVVVRFDTNGVVLQSKRGAAFGSYGQPAELAGLRFTVPSRPLQREGVLWVVDRESAIDRLLGALKVIPRENTNVADVAYSGPDSVLAQQVANRI